MRVWYRSAALAGTALLWVGVHARAQIRETVGLPPAHPPKGGLKERPNHPVVLLHSREGEFTGGERTTTQFILKQIDPVKAVEKVTPPKGIDGIIAYLGSQMLMVRGTREAVAGYRAALEQVDRAAGLGEPGKPGKEGEATSDRPVILLPATAKLRLEADRLQQDGQVMQATGHVVIGLA